MEFGTGLGGGVGGHSVLGGVGNAYSLEYFAAVGGVANVPGD
jgi:hypothetical protein